MASAPNDDAPRDENLVTLAAVDRALADRQFFLVYQPTMDLQSGAFVGVEALLRWRHPNLGVLGPDRFVARLESTGAIVEVGAWVVAEACRQGAEWHALGARLAVSVNVAAVQLADDGLVSSVDRAVADSGFDPGHLVLEFAEQTLIEATAEQTSHLEALRDLGVRVAVDDFGSGEESKELLGSLPVDIVKIDRAFIATIGASSAAAARVHDLVQLGKSLGVQTIAQGIEDDDQRLRLQLEDVDVGQGFLFSVPHTPEEIDRFLEDFAIFSGRPL